MMLWRLNATHDRASGGAFCKYFREPATARQFERRICACFWSVEVVRVELSIGPASARRLCDGVWPMASDVDLLRLSGDPLALAIGSLRAMLGQTGDEE
ncbi:hypothetical protein [Anatilimnocola floriformis]|uniref:hypothetical protein n=1 Tax=Anatilimnocola floriformis TaxID=2948575 RepID=UPI0020C24456|nr:hypothetical protein [Anatilimnocola floriformis]